VYIIFAENARLLVGVILGCIVREKFAKDGFAALLHKIYG